MALTWDFCFWLGANVSDDHDRIDRVGAMWRDRERMSLRVRALLCVVPRVREAG